MSTSAVCQPILRHTGRVLYKPTVGLTSITKRLTKCFRRPSGGHQFANLCRFCCRKGYEGCTQIGQGCRWFVILPLWFITGSGLPLATLLVAFADLRTVTLWRRLRRRKPSDDWKWPFASSLDCKIGLLHPTVFKLAPTNGKPNKHFFQIRKSQVDLQ